jgi:hypothetical protein
MAKGRSRAQYSATGCGIPCSDSAALGRDSGSGRPSGIPAACSSPSSRVWNDAIIDRMGEPD